MYEIRPDSIKTFINDSRIKLPRFQRKQTWDAKKNFQLCISLFKDYPIGVCILTGDSSVGGQQRKYLLDGRQRRNALKKMYDDPENIYIWAKDFIKFKPTDQPSEVSEKFEEAIKNFLEAEDEELDSSNTIYSSPDPYSEIINEQSEFEEELPLEELEEGPEDVEVEYNPSHKSGLDLLLDIILLIHKKTPKKSGFTAPFDFTDSVSRLPYVQQMDGNSYRLVSQTLKAFILQYRNFCQSDCDDEYQLPDNFIKFIITWYDVRDKAKLKSTVLHRWNQILERIEMLQRIDDVLSESKIGVIDVKDMNQSDYQKIFNLINSQGEPLKAIEILSAKQKWNKKISNPSETTIEYVNKLYKEIGTSVDGVVRWDLPATFISRLGDNFIFKYFDPQKSAEFIKGITVGFKAISGIFVHEVTKEGIERLSSERTFWDLNFDDFIRDVKDMLRVLSSYSYFQFFQTWKSNIMSLTSDYIALDFFILTYLDWQVQGRPIGGGINMKTFQKNAFILLDKLLYEYAMGMWRSSADAKIKNNILAFEANYKKVETEQWLNLLNEIFNNNQINGKNVSVASQKGILYHFYSLNEQAAPSSTDITFDIDHIIPKALFEESTFENKEIIKDNILNLGILPTRENISKGRKRLVELTDSWLKRVVKDYEFVNPEDFERFSDVGNYADLFEYRRPIFIMAFDQCRTHLLNN